MTYLEGIPTEDVPKVAQRVQSRYEKRKQTLLDNGCVFQVVENKLDRFMGKDCEKIVLVKNDTGDGGSRGLVVKGGSHNQKVVSSNPGAQ